MDNDKFIELCKEKVVEYINIKFPERKLEYMDNGVLSIPSYISTDSVYVVWLNRTLQNNKALLSTTLTDGMYYEVTYNGDKNELYFDAYSHVHNRAFKLDE